jgi:acetaldehyde dehydrogenase (acetylating)
MGHTASIHTASRDAAREYGVLMPVSRVVVNSPSTHGAIGFTTDLEPSMTLGCGSWGGNVTSDNISPRHLVDVKRIAFETRPINQIAEPRAAATASGHQIDRAAIASIVDKFLAERQAQLALQQPPAPSLPQAPPQPEPPQSAVPQPAVPQAATAPQANGKVYDFVCEEDVRRAMAAREKIRVNSRTIITPAARDLGEDNDVFARA